MFRAMTPRQIAFDVSIALACALLELVVILSSGSLSFIALVGMATALALRRLSPTLALSLIWVTALIQVLLNFGPDPSNLAIFPVLYATASYGKPLEKWAGLVSSFAGAFVIAAYSWWASFVENLAIQFDFSETVGSISQIILTFLVWSAAFALSWTLGLLAKTWRTSRENNQARVFAEYARIDAQQNVIVEQERNRIARDMHDVVAHSLAVVIAQADGARYARQSDPDAVDVALATISSTARDALGDVRILLGQLRHSQTDAPQPVLADLERVYEQMRSAGLSLRVEVSGEPTPLSGGVQLAVFRIVQEALTNALRHGATSESSGGSSGETPDETIVTFTWLAEVLRVEITNPIDDASAGDAAPDHVMTLRGHGLAGMAERALLVGGSLSAVADGRHFVVDATIPVAQSEVFA